VYAPYDRDIPLLSYTAINFGADISNLNMYSVYSKGVFGGLNAYYTRQPLYDKINEYSGSETRDIRFFPIWLSEAEYAKLMQSLESVREKPIPYKFFSYNCSHGIYQLLFDSLEGLPKQPKQAMTPLDVVDILNSNNRIGKPFLLPSLYERVLNTENNEQAELEYLEWVNKQTRTKPNAEREKRLSQLRFSISQQNTERPDLFSYEQQWRKPHKYSRVELGVSQVEGDLVTNIGFRPLLHDHTDSQFFYSGVNNLELLSTNFNVYRNTIDLAQLDFIHLRSTPAYEKWFRFTSYDFLVRYKASEYHYNLGVGKSMYISKKYGLVLELMLYDSLRKSEIYKNFIGLDTHFTKRADGNIRYGINYRHLYQGFSYHPDTTLELWIARDLGKDFSVYLESIWEKQQKENVKLGVRYYF